jgi:hypothetical protein
MQNEIGAVVLAGLSGVFACYGIQELTYAYKSTAFQEWSLRGLLGGGGVLLGALFLVMIRQMLS